MAKAIRTSKLPRTDSIQELAKFWDKHDLTDFEEGLEEVTEPVFVHGASIDVHLSSSQARALERLAKAKGVSQAELVREWVQQKLPKGNGTKSRTGEARKT